MVPTNVSVDESQELSELYGDDYDDMESIFNRLVLLLVPTIRQFLIFLYHSKSFITSLVPKLRFYKA